MMKILYVSTISDTINAFMIPHIEMLLDQGHHVDIACSMEKEIDSNLINRGCRVFDINFNRNPISKNNIMAYKQLKALLENIKYDVIHTHTPIASALVRLVSKRLSNIKVIYTAHGFHFFKGAPLINWIIYYPIEKMLARYTDILITINQDDYDLAIKRNFKSKQIVLLNGVGINLEKFQPQTEEKKIEIREQYGYAHDDFILICVGELNFNKHQDLVIEVASKLKDKIPKLKIILAGKGRLEDCYNKQIIDLGVQNNVELLGYRSDIDKLMVLADVAVSASRREGLPVNIMEAMATGLPLVVSNCRGNRDLVKNNENGYIVEFDAIDKFANSIEKLYKSKELREEFGRNSIKMIQKYSLKDILENMAIIYKVNKNLL